MQIIQVLKGQIWKDNDPRSAGRQVEVVEVHHNEGYAVVKNTATGRQTEVSFEAFRGTDPRRTSTKRGYSLVKDVD